MKDYVSELVGELSCFGPVKSRRMFGAYGIFYQGLMFGLVNDGQLFLKVDAASKSLFVERKCAQFRYRRAEKWVGLSYFAAPPDMFSSPDSTLRWATVAYESALRAQAARPARRKTRDPVLPTFARVQR